LITHNHGVPRIRSSVVANNHIVIGGKQIDDLAFAFIAPLQADDGGMRAGGSGGRVVMGGHGEVLRKS
jgi:hypothetical protein